MEQTESLLHKLSIATVAQILQELNLYALNIVDGPQDQVDKEREETNRLADLAAEVLRDKIA